jgi:hypothetical protein
VNNVVVDQGVFLGLETRQGLYPSSLATWRSLAVHVYMYICDAWRTPRHHPCFLIVPASSSFFRSGLAWLSLSLAKLARDQPAVLSLPTPTEPPHLYASIAFAASRSPLQLLFPATGVLNSGSSVARWAGRQVAWSATAPRRRLC